MFNAQLLVPVWIDLLLVHVVWIDLHTYIYHLSNNIVYNAENIRQYNSYWL